jgi:hypothetical protein
MNSLLNLNHDSLEVSARLFARNRASEIARVLVDECLRGRGVDSDETRIVEDRVETLLGSFLKLGIVEFTGKYVAELERRAEASLDLAKEVLRTTPNTTIIHRAGQVLARVAVCPVCGHEHDGVCQVSMGGAGVCGCTAEVRV